MKHILLFFTFLWAATAFGQKLELNEVDEFTGSINKRTKQIAFYAKMDGNGYIKVAKYNDSYRVYIAPNPKLGCAGVDDNNVIFLFEDGTTLKLENDLSPIDCGVFVFSKYQFNPNDFEGKVVSKIRVQMGNAYRDFEWRTKRFTFNELIKAVE